MWNIFENKFIHNDEQTEPQKSCSTCGYSPMAILLEYVKDNARPRAVIYGVMTGHFVKKITNKNFLKKGIDIPFFICYNVDTLKKGNKINGKDNYIRY